MSGVDFLNKININNVDIQYQDIVEEIGVENFIKLIIKFGGTTLYIPKLSTVYSAEIKAYIISNYDGRNKRKLANEFGVSDKTIQNIIRENINSRW